MKKKRDLTILQIEVTPDYIYATALVVVALSLAYWLVVVKNPDEKP